MWLLHTGILCRFTMVYCWKTIYQELKKINVWTVNVWSIMVKGSKLCELSLFLLKGGAQIVILTLWAVTRIGIWLARLSIHWHRVMSSPIVWRNLQEGLHFIAENKIFLRNSFFSSTDTCRFLYWLIERLRVNRMFTTNFRFYSKLVLEKAM